MDKREKDCAYLVMVLLAGVALGAVGGFVFGWLWMEGSDSTKAIRLAGEFIVVGSIVAVVSFALRKGKVWMETGTTRLVDVFVATGTIGAVIVAVFISLFQNQDTRNKEKARLVTEAARLAPIFKFTAGQIDFLLNEFYPNEENRGEQAITVLTRQGAYLSSYEMISGSLADIWEIDPEMAKWVSYHGSFLFTQGKAFIQNPHANVGLSYGDYFARYSPCFTKDLKEGVEAAKINLTKSIDILESYFRQP